MGERSGEREKQGERERGIRNGCRAKATRATLGATKGISKQTKLKEKKRKSIIRRQAGEAKQIHISDGRRIAKIDRENITIQT